MKPGHERPARLGVERRRAVVAHLGARHRDDLAGVGRIGEDFLVAGHARVEHDLARRDAFGAAAHAFETHCRPRAPAWRGAASSFHAPTPRASSRRSSDAVTRFCWPAVHLHRRRPDAVARRARAGRRASPPPPPGSVSGVVPTDAPVELTVAPPGFDETTEAPLEGRRRRTAAASSSSPAPRSSVAGGRPRGLAAARRCRGVAVRRRRARRPVAGAAGRRRGGGRRGGRRPTTGRLAAPGFAGAARGRRGLARAAPPGSPPGTRGRCRRSASPISGTRLPARCSIADGSGRRRRRLERHDARRAGAWSRRRRHVDVLEERRRISAGCRARRRARPASRSTSSASRRSGIGSAARPGRRQIDHRPDARIRRGCGVRGLAGRGRSAGSTPARPARPGRARPAWRRPARALGDRAPWPRAEPAGSRPARTTRGTTAAASRRAAARGQLGERLGSGAGSRGSSRIRAAAGS